jgi:hypothetical protein
MTHDLTPDGPRSTSHRRWLAALLGVVTAFVGAFRVAEATSGWVELAKASFNGASDGAGDGRSFTAAVGTLTTSTSCGKSLKDAAPGSGIVKERVVLSDVSTLAGTTLGLRLGATRAATGGAYASVVVEPLSDGGRFTIGATESGDVDFCLPGSASDGVTVECFAVDSDEGALSVGGTKLKTALRKGTRYRFEMLFHEVGITGDYVELWITNLATNEVEYLSQALVTGYLPLQALTVRKHAGKAGEWALDDFVILAPPQ